MNSYKTKINKNKNLVREDQVDKENPEYSNQMTHICQNQKKRKKNKLKKDQALQEERMIKLKYKQKRIQRWLH